jgi:HEAT repeat protein
MNRRFLPCIACAVTMALVGCKPEETNKKGYYPTPKLAPPVPPAKATPIDPNLQAQAQQQVDSALASSDEIVRAHALEVLKLVNSPEAATRIVAALGDSSSLVRKAASFAAGELRTKEATDRLNANLPATEAPGKLQERMAIIFALHRLGDTSHSHIFEATASDPDEHIRGDTAFILGMLGERSAVGILLQMLYKDRSAPVRLQAAEALWKLGDERGEDELIKSTVSMYPDDKMIALLALAQPHDTRVLGHVDGLLTDDYPEVGLIAARAAGMLGSDSGYGVALNGAKNVDPRQRLLAAMAFGAIGRADAQPELAKLLADDNADTRLAAAGALLQIGKR